MSDNAPATAAATPGPLAGLIITGIVVILLVAWIVLWMMGLKMHDTTLVGGFLLLWYWANNEALEIKRLAPTIVGSLAGIFLAWFVVFATVEWGNAGTLAGVGLMVVALYLDVIKAAPFVINTATMLFLTLAAAPLVQLHVDWRELVISTVVGGIFFGVTVEGLKRLAARFAPAA